MPFCIRKQDVDFNRVYAENQMNAHPVLCPSVLSLFSMSEMEKSSFLSQQDMICFNLYIIQIIAYLFVFYHHTFKKREKVVYVCLKAMWDNYQPPRS